MVEARDTFDANAQSYDRVRPDYPEPMVDCVLGAVSVSPARILEIGPGTGKATLAFARRGHAMVCVEPGANLMEIAEHKCAGLDVRFHNARFEDWPLESAAFDLAISGQAFHWVDPAVGPAKVADALRSGGVFAPFWNLPVFAESRLRSELDAIYARHAPEFDRDKSNAVAELAGPLLVEQLDALDRFEPVEMHRFRFVERHRTERYIELLQTYSNHAMLPPDRAAGLYAEIREALDDNGGYMSQDREAVVFLARKR